MNLLFSEVVVNRVYKCDGGRGIYIKLTGGSQVSDISTKKAKSHAWFLFCLLMEALDQRSKVSMCVECSF